MEQIYRRMRVTMGLILVLLITPDVHAHHIMGIPHYAYDEQYPQTPVLTYRMEAGPYDVKMTGYPGMPQPGERCTFHIYIRRIDTGALYDGKVSLTVLQDRLIGQDPVIYGPVEAGLEERVFKFYPEFKEEANYTTRISFVVEGTPWIVDLPVVAGEPGSPWVVLGSVGGGLAIFLIVVRAIRIKRRRRLRVSVETPDDGRPVMEHVVL